MRLQKGRKWLIMLLSFLLGLALWLPFKVPGNDARTVPFVFTDVKGRTVRLSDFAGKWVLVNFWASWCPLCLPEMPILGRLNQRPDLAVIGICLDYGQDEAKARDAIERHDLDFTAQVLGGSRRNPNAAFRQVGPVDFFPTSYLYDPSGEIVMFIPGQVSYSKIANFIAAWRPKGAPAASSLFYAMDPAKFKTALGRYGAGGRKAYSAWIDLAGKASKVPVDDKLAMVNAFFNQRIRRATDRQVWHRDEYWASPAETLGVGRGDSDDIAVAKYFSLLAFGVPGDRLRLIYTKRLDVAQGADPVYMVLAYYPEPNREPLLLDDFDDSIQPASQHRNLRPVFSFNSQDVWGDTGSMSAGEDSSTARLPIWQETLLRAHREGFE